MKAPATLMALCGTVCRSLASNIAIGQLDIICPTNKHILLTPGLTSGTLHT
jgi:hypothetical protein